MILHVKNSNLFTCRAIPSFLNENKDSESHKPMAGFQNALKTHRFLLCILPIDITLGNFSAANASLSCISKVRIWAKKKYCFGHVYMQITLDFCLFQNHSLFSLIVKVKRFHCKDYVRSLSWSV